MAFKIRNEPRRPVRNKIRKTCNVWDGDSISDILTRLDAPDALVEDVFFKLDSWGSEAYILVDESDSDYDNRLKIYGKAIAAYEEWYAENKDTIGDERARKKLLADKKKATRKVNEKLKLETEIGKLQKKLSKI